MGEGGDRGVIRDICGHRRNLRIAVLLYDKILIDASARVSGNMKECLWALQEKSKAVASKAKTLPHPACNLLSCPPSKRVEIPLRTYRSITCHPSDLRLRP